MPVSFPESISIMGIGINPFKSYSQATSCVAAVIAEGGRSFCAAVNPEKVYRAINDRALAEALSRADLRICDGIGVAWAARILTGRRIRRCTGVDLFLALAEKGASLGWKVFLLGAGPESNDGACRVLRARYPGLVIVGQRHGFFENDGEIIDQINASGADLLFVAMGSPRQEFWIAKNRSRLNVPFCMGVGGTWFDGFGIWRSRPWRGCTFPRNDYLRFISAERTAAGWWKGIRCTRYIRMRGLRWRFLPCGKRGARITRTRWIAVFDGWWRRRN